MNQLKRKRLADFPKGKDSYLKTYFNVVDYILHSEDNAFFSEVFDERGKESFYDIAIRLTDEFEQMFDCKDEQSRLLLLSSFLNKIEKQL